MGEDTWLVIEDDLNHCATDSDAIDSETEAELYSAIHYEQNINSHISNPGKFENIVSNDNSSTADFSSLNVNNFYMQKQQQTENLKENEISSHRNASLHKFNCDSNPCKKFKTDFACKASSNNLNPDDLKNDSQKLWENVKSITQCSSDIKQSSKKFDSTIVFDSTDSDDSIIWKEVDSFAKSDFTINLSKDDVDTIYLTSSDSDSELPSTSSDVFRRRESVLKNLSMPNIKIEENHEEGEWYINSEDVYRSRKYSRRYHNNSDSLCSNCNRKGHNFKNCQEPKVLKCFICGGTHLGFRCPNRICGTCFRYGHDRMRCQMGPNSFYCALCSMPGHTIQICPDLWRRYHLTTNPQKIVKGRKVKQDTNMYCWNCGQIGHFGGVCQNGFFRNSVNTWPCVISYEHPKQMFRNKRLFQEKNLNDWRIGLNFSSNEESVSFDDEWKKQKKAIRAAKRKEKRKEKKLLKELGKEKPDQEKQKCKQRIRKTEKKIKNVVRDKNFPRVPKQIWPQQNDKTPKSAQVLMDRKRRRQKKIRKQRLLKRQLKRQQVLIDATPIKVEKD